MSRYADIIITVWICISLPLVFFGRVSNRPSDVAFGLVILIGSATVYRFKQIDNSIKELRQQVEKLFLSKNP